MSVLVVQRCPTVKVVHNRGCTAGALVNLDNYRLQWNALEQAKARLKAGGDAEDEARTPPPCCSSLRARADAQRAMPCRLVGPCVHATTVRRPDRSVPLTSFRAQAANSMSVMSNALPAITSSVQRNSPLVPMSEAGDEKSKRRRVRTRSRRGGSKSADPKLSETKRRMEV